MTVIFSTAIRFHFRKSGAGGLAGTRTLDQCLKRALLYQLSYQPPKGIILKKPQKLARFFLD
jgi:hypothetical protein